MTALVLTDMYLIGPFSLFYYHALLDIKEHPFRYMVHLLPSFLIFIFVSFYFSSMHAYLKQIIFKDIFDGTMIAFINIFFIGGVIHITSYYLFLLKIEFSVLKNINIKKTVKLIIIITIVSIFLILSEAIGFLFKNKKLYAVGGILSSIFFIFFFIIYTKYRRYFVLFKKEINKVRYARSLLNGVNIDAIINRLNELMIDEKLYRDYEINLKKLSGMLSVTPHQLSQFLNEKLHIDFRNFINKYRVEEAKILLTEKPPRPVLNICYDVGFNSKTSFYISFKEFTGMTPIEFREKK